MGQGAQGSEVAAGNPKLMAQPGSLSGRQGSLCNGPVSSDKG